MRYRVSRLTALVGAGLLLAAGAQSQTTGRVSVASDGIQGNNRSSAAAISADGCFVAFYSIASNLAKFQGWHEPPIVGAAGEEEVI